MSSKYCGTVPILINVPQYPNNEGHLEILCVKLHKNAALAEHWSCDKIFFHFQIMRKILSDEPIFISL